MITKLETTEDIDILKVRILDQMPTGWTFTAILIDDADPKDVKCVVFGTTPLPIAYGAMQALINNKKLSQN